MKKEYYETRYIRWRNTMTWRVDETWCTLASDNGVNRNDDEKWWKMERTHQNKIKNSKLKPQDKD